MSNLLDYLIKQASIVGDSEVRRACKAFLKRKPHAGITPTKRKKIPREWVRQALDRQGGLCKRVPHPLEFKDATGDHRVPLALRGSHDPSNIDAMCRKHNSSKNANSPMAESKRTGKTILEQL